MIDGGQWEESTALAGIMLMLGFDIADLPKDVFMSPRPATPTPAAPTPATALRPQGWYPDPAQRFELRWDGQHWTPTVATNSRTCTNTPAAPSSTPKYSSSAMPPCPPRPGEMSTRSATWNR